MIEARIEIMQTDITKLEVDAIVNTANNSLLGGGGVDGAIHHAAGPDLLKECCSLGGCQTGQAKITKGYRLPARFVIHTVGPVWNGGQNSEKELLASCYRTSLQIALANELTTIAFPAISCGIYRFSIPEACLIAMHEVYGFLAKNECIQKVIFACFDQLIEKELMKNWLALNMVFRDAH